MKKRVATNTMTFRSRSSAEMKAMYKAERRVKKAGLGRVIASRVLTEENARDHKITVTVGAPRRVEADHWLCPYYNRRNRRVGHPLRLRCGRTAIACLGASWHQGRPRKYGPGVHLVCRRPRNSSPGSNGTGQDFSATRRKSDFAGVQARIRRQDASSQA
jgi:hypothetical protein